MSKPPRLLWLFVVWLAAFYTVWLLVVVLGYHWQTIVGHWQIAVAMALGSYVAGSTPLGGGTVGFPVIVLTLDHPATIGRDFSLAVQSIGMVSASIFIFASRRPLVWPMLKWAIAGATIGTPLGVLFVAPHLSDLFIKLFFSVIWASFGIMSLAKLRDFTRVNTVGPTTERFDALTGLSVGLLGGATVTAVTGAGVDMLLYVVLVLVSRAELRVAIPSSVVLMAYASVVGLITTVLQGQVHGETYANWLAAAPIVAVGAPLGALAVALIPRLVTHLIVTVLCLLQFVWMSVHEQVGSVTLAWCLAAVAAINVGFHLLHRWGRHRGDITLAST